MKIKNFKIRNFRGYKGEVTIDFDNFTAFVGKNDIGKASEVFASVFTISIGQKEY